MNLGRAISLCRKQRRLTQETLATKAGLSKSYLSLLEQNKRRDPTLSTIQKLAEAIGVPTGILFYLAADETEMAGIDAELSRRLAHTALEMLKQKDDPEASLFPSADS